MGKELDAIRKKLGHLSLYKKPSKYLDTGLPELNRVVGHCDLGIPYGKVIELYGLNSHGKTALALALAALAQRDQARVIWEDLENSWDEGWATRRGLDVSQVELIHPYAGKFGDEKDERLPYAQELCSEAEALMCALKMDKQFLVLDSIAAMETEGESMAGLENQNLRTNMDLPLFMGKLLRRWVARASVHNTTIVMINQLRMKPVVKFGSPWYTPGGNAPSFYAHVRLRIRKTGPIKDKSKNIGIQGTLEAVKNKCGGEEGAVIGYRLLRAGPLEFVDAKEVAYKKEED